MSVLNKYGEYNYDDPSSGMTATKHVIQEYPFAIDAKQRTAETPGRDGLYTMANPGILVPPLTYATNYIEEGVIQARQLTVKGHLIPDPAVSLEDAWREFVAAHYPGVLWPLFLGDDSRYVLAEALSVRDAQASNYPSSRPWEIRFLCPSPQWISATQTTESLSTGTNTITSFMGSAPAAPVITLPITTLGSGATITLTLSNVSWSKSLVIAAPGALTTLTVDFASQSIINTAGDDVTDLITSGVWWRLQPQFTQDVTITATGGLALTSPSIAWYDRWL